MRSAVLPRGTSELRRDAEQCAEEEAAQSSTRTNAPRVAAVADLVGGGRPIDATPQAKRVVGARRGAAGAGGGTGGYDAMRRAAVAGDSGARRINLAPTVQRANWSGRTTVQQRCKRAGGCWPRSRDAGGAHQRDSTRKRGAVRAHFGAAARHRRDTRHPPVRLFLGLGRLGGYDRLAGNAAK